jgi:RNase H-like domain found in reverse transcriptase
LDTELNYNTHDKELMEIYEAFKAWKHYLEGTKVPIDVVMDHKNLEYFCTTQILSGDKLSGQHSCLNLT